MLQLRRQSEIIELLRLHRELTVKELCALLYTSPATVRRDLAELEQKGLLRRSFGGAVLNEAYTDQLPLAIRRAEHISEKKRIAGKASALVHAGDTIFVDASSTTYFLSEPLRRLEEITVITNSLHLSAVLAESGVRTFCTGGEMLRSSVALVGSEAERFIGGFYASAVFFSARGFGGGEATDSSKGERDIKLAMMSRSEKHYLLIDSSKYGKRYAYRIAGEESIDEIFDERDEKEENR